MNPRKSRVFLADANPAIRSALTLLLEIRLPLQVVGEADSMPKLLAGLAVSYPDILLMDWDLPGARQAERVSPIRSVHTQLKVVITSSRPENVSLEQAARADAYLCKSDPPEKVLSVMRGLLTDHLTRLKTTQMDNCKNTLLR